MADIETIEADLKKLEQKELEHREKGITYCESWYVDMDLACDMVLEFIETGAKLETFVAWMIDEGYDMSIFQ